MTFHARAFAMAIAAAAIAAAPADATDRREGFLCCNMRSDGSWISDGNYAESGKRVVPVGTPVTVTGSGRSRIKLLIDGKRQEIGNDYSRDLSDAEFSARYVVADDPKAKIAGYPQKIRDAIVRAKVTPGMTREQVVMALGWPMSSENPDLDADLWRYWRSSFDEFQVHFAGGRVSDVTADPATRNLVWTP